MMKKLLLISFAFSLLLPSFANAAMTSLNGFQTVPWENAVNIFSFGSQTMATSTPKIAWILQASRSCNIQNILFRTGATVTVGGNVAFSVQGVTTSTGHANGTLLVANASATVNIPTGASAQSFFSGNLGATTTVSLGQYFSVVASGTAVNLTLASVDGQTYNSQNLFPYAEVGSSTWTRTTQAVPIIGVQCDDGTFMNAMTYPIDSIVDVSFGSSSAASVYGNTCQFPVPMSVGGVWIDIGSGHDFQVFLYGADKNTVYASTTVYTATNNQNGTIRHIHAFFNATTTIPANTTTTLVVQATSVTADLRFDGFTATSSAAMDSFEMGKGCYQVTATGSLAFTGVPGSRMFMGLLVFGYDNGVSTGGGGALNSFRILWGLGIANIPLKDSAAPLAEAEAGLLYLAFSRRKKPDATE